MSKNKSKLLVTATISFTIIYLIWRTVFTLPFQYGVVSIIFAMILLLAEITGLFEQILHFYSMSNKEKPEPKRVTHEHSTYPTVDVFIATYNEPKELLYKTINGCVNMKYPEPEKVTIYLCDDGKREEIKELADKFGIQYLAREGNEGAKAGNLNNALANSTGELVVTFDADMIPMSDFLLASVPYFMDSEEEIGFVQTPQSFYNLDLFQFNLFSEDTIPNEQDYFYKDIQLSKNKFNAVIYGGSNTVISRKALDDIGGFVTSVITEDFATGMLIQSKGYKCIATDEVHASGLSPEDLENLISQRKRWARGCIQTGKKLNVLFRKGLTMPQKVSYLNSIFYWYSPIKRLIYMLSPILYSVFNIRVVETTPIQLLIFWLPMYLLNSKTLRHLSGNIRTIRWTNIYETIMFPLLLKDVLLEVIGIQESTFAVTKKGVRDNKSVRYVKHAIPHFLLLAMNLIGIVHCIDIMFISGNISILFLAFWLSLNTYNLIMAVLFLLGRKERRVHTRFSIDAQVMIDFEGRRFETTIYDISEGGFSVILDKPEYMPPDDIARVTIKTECYEATVSAMILQVQALDNDYEYRYSFRITRMEEEDYKALLLIIHDRVPPLTQTIKSDYGFFEDLRVNLEKRRQKLNYYSRKLPRIKLHRELITTEGDDVTILSFNYEYMAIKHRKSMLNVNNIFLPIEGDMVIELLRIKEIGYYDIPEEEKLTMEVTLYHIVNVKDIIEYPDIASIMIRLQKESLSSLLEEIRQNNKKDTLLEYDEMELI
ncbi:MAG: glycosyltransferase [bacterium]|nr:glycosyltransferase [bacterium]